MNYRQQSEIRSRETGMERAALESLGMKMLVGLATQNSIKGRHSMRRNQLIEALVSASEESISGACSKAVAKAAYITSAKVGTIIAFRVSEIKTLSGMIEEIHKNDFIVRTRSGVLFTVAHGNVVWVKTGERWPKGVYDELKGASYGNNRAENKVSKEAIR